MKKSHFYLGILICISILWACNNASDTVTNDAVDEDTIVRTDTLDSKNGVTETMFTIPSPFETALLLQRAGAVYNAEILNPSDKWADYTTDISKGLNLGVYSADLCFTTIFDQTETSCKYIASCKKLAEELSIM
ncbi:MAG: hypothetical protein KJ607_12895, partial [Bacteroidetes bacterium]|nr:hypothetical protein [Bacteroidota bacterium]